MDVGDEYVYRLKDDSPSERVRIVSLGPPKQHRRIVVEFGDGTTEDVPVRRLKAPWSKVEQYDRDEEVWTRFRAVDYEPGEELAVRNVMKILIPETVARRDIMPADFTTTIVDEPELSKLLGIPSGQLLEDFESVIVNGLPIVSGMTSLYICEMACRNNPMPVLDDLRERETEAMIRSKAGHNEPYRGGKKPRVSYTPHEDHEYYLRSLRPEFELIRQWCGNRAVSFQERMIAAEQECHRLELIVVDALKRIYELEGESRQFHAIRDDYSLRRITPESVRPIVERPLSWRDCPPPPGANQRFGRKWR
ncbi:hypothetical protein [Rhodococcoides fascians]|uniref:hypothetical protein n=1 Tax=Rhodococcoides fascians TaxID=1828 RepID=UPI000564437E|nr:hypothetical protein [Rhodococcus fascians]